MQQEIQEVFKAVKQELEQAKSPLLTGYKLALAVQQDLLRENELAFVERDLAREVAAELRGQRDLALQWKDAFAEQVEALKEILREQAVQHSVVQSIDIVDMAESIRSAIAAGSSFKPPARSPQPFDMGMTLGVFEPLLVTARMSRDTAIADRDRLQVLLDNEIELRKGWEESCKQLEAELRGLRNAFPGTNGQAGGARKPLLPPTSENYPQRIDRAVEMYQAGASKAAILDETNIYHPQLIKVLRERGIALKSEQAADSAEPVEGQAEHVTDLDEEDEALQEWQTRIPQVQEPGIGIIEPQVPEPSEDATLRTVNAMLDGSAKLPVTTTTLTLEQILGIVHGCIDRLTAPAIAQKIGYRVQELSRYRWIEWGNKIANDHNCLARPVAKGAYLDALETRIRKQLEAVAV